MSLTGGMSDPLEFQGNITEDGHVTLDFELDPTINGADPTSTEQDPTLISGTTRKPRVKLTAEKLLSKKGLPYVVQHAPKSCRISKKKSPYDNLTGFLQFYQLWAHELYPKAKFKDFVALCGSLGRTDRDLREYRTNLIRKDMGMLIDEDVDGDTLQEQREPSPSSPPPPQSSQPPQQNGLFVTEEVDSHNFLQRNQSAPHTDHGDDDDDDDDVLYSSRRKTRTDNTSSQLPSSSTVIPTAEEIEEMERAADGIATASDDEMDLLREMQQ